MFKKIALTAASIIAVASFSTTASAQFVAGQKYNVQTQGSQLLEVSQSTTLECKTPKLTMTASSPTAGTINASGALQSGDALCFLVNLSGTWNVNLSGSGPLHNVTITGVTATTIMGSCTGGTLAGTYNSSTGVIDITSSSGWTSSPAGMNCGVKGKLTVS